MVHSLNSGSSEGAKLRRVCVQHPLGLELISPANNPWVAVVEDQGCKSDLLPGSPSTGWEADYVTQRPSQLQDDSVTDSSTDS